MKSVFLAAIIAASGIAFVVPAAHASCRIITPGPCGPNNPVTQRVPVTWYTVREIVPCPDPNVRFYIVASNGRLWHDTNHRWDWSRIHVGTQFRLANSWMDDKGVLHGDVVWPWES
jgi:hypothetical protein